MGAQPSYDDTTLINLLKQGNDLAFQEIYNRYWERLFAYVYNRLHIRETSEEVVQDVFVSLWVKRESLSISSTLSAYLFGAVKHRMLNELRSQKVRKTYAADLSLFIFQQTDNSNIDYQNLKDLEHAIELGLADLPKQCQTVFRMSRQQHMPNVKIAEHLNISTKTVENYLTQALKHLRTSIGEVMVLGWLFLG